jgi:hypothetical protein
MIHVTSLYTRSRNRYLQAMQCNASSSYQHLICERHRQDQRMSFVQISIRCTNKANVGRQSYHEFVLIHGWIMSMLHQRHKTSKKKRLYSRGCNLANNVMNMHHPSHKRTRKEDSHWQEHEADNFSVSIILISIRD